MQHSLITIHDFVSSVFDCNTIVH